MLIIDVVFPILATAKSYPNTTTILKTQYSNSKKSLQQTCTSLKGAVGHSDCSTCTFITNRTKTDHKHLSSQSPHCFREGTAFHWLHLKKKPFCKNHTLFHTVPLETAKKLAVGVCVNVWMWQVRSQTCPSPTVCMSMMVTMPGTWGLRRVALWGEPSSSGAPEGSVPASWVTTLPTMVRPVFRV